MVFYVNMLFAGVVQSRRRVLLREGGFACWWDGRGMAAAEGRRVQLQVQVRCSVMADLDGTRLNALCLVGWSLKTRAGKERGAVNWGRQDGQTTDLTRHQDVYVLHGLKRRGKWRGRVVVQAVDGGAQLPKVELKVALRQARID